MRRAVLLAVIGMALPAAAYAGHAGGNGGDGIRINGRLYLLDLAERGIERNPRIDRTRPLDPEIVRRLTAKLDPSEYPVQLLARKIREIQAKRAPLAEMILRAIEFQDWMLVSTRLPNVTDEEALALGVPRSRLVQLAVRGNDGVRISRPGWNELDAANRVALITHEAIYTVMPPMWLKRPGPGGGLSEERCAADLQRDRKDDYARGAGYWPCSQPSAMARKLNAALFGQELAERSVEELALPYESMLGLSPGLSEQNVWTTNAEFFVYAPQFTVKSTLREDGRPVGLGGKGRYLTPAEEEKTVGIIRQNLADGGFGICPKPGSATAAARVEVTGMDLFFDTAAVEYFDTTGRRAYLQVSEHLWSSEAPVLDKQYSEAESSRCVEDVIDAIRKNRPWLDEYKIAN